MTEKNSEKTTSNKVLKRVKKARLAAVKSAAKCTMKVAKGSDVPKKTGKNVREKARAGGHFPGSARISVQKGPVQKEASKTVFAPAINGEREWILIDANGQTVGRLATEISRILRGKHKPSFTPNNDVGDFVVVINAKGLKFTKNKEETKEYFQHSGWVGGMKVRTAAQLKETYPERILEKAVKGMIERNPLGRRQMKKLKVYGGSEHPHAAQNPKVWAAQQNQA